MTDTIQTDEFLAHFGIKGMKWGVTHEIGTTGRVTGSVSSGGTRGSAGSSSSSTKGETRQLRRNEQAAKFVKKADAYQTRIKDLQGIIPKGKLAQKDKADALKDLEGLKQRALKDAEAKRNGKLSSTQKKVIIGASVAAVILAGAVAYRLGDSGEFNRLAASGKAALAGQKLASFEHKAELASKNLSADAVHSLVVKPINPGYGALGTKMNCRRATFAYELRRRGLDVMATKTIGGTGQNAAGLLNATTPGVEIRSHAGAFVADSIRQGLGKQGRSPLTEISEAVGSGARNSIPTPNPKTVFEALAKQPNGSRGELAIKWPNGANHSMAYEIFNGKPVVFDAQNGSKYSSIMDLANGGLMQLKQAGYTRLDNVALNQNFLLKWVKAATKSA